jgi:phosphoribosyl 1,2-cyclic phosphodiesterase
MSPEQSMLVRFWGVRGTIASPGADTVRYGGNTSCVEVRCGKHSVIFDGGTGIRKLGDRLVASDAPIEADILFSHFHMDHVGGIPLFAPLYAAGHHFRLWGGNLLPEVNLQGVIRTIISAPLFPIGFETFRSDVEFRDFRVGDVLRLRDGIEVRTAALNHPGGSIGYRLEFAGRSIAYLTDTEHGLDQLDANVVSLAKNADLMIYDGTYTDKEFSKYVGWGHSTWQHALRVADAAGAKQVAIFHHDPDRDDAALDGIAAAAQQARPGTLVAQEGLELAL